MYALLCDVMYCLEGYFVDLINLCLSCVAFTTGLACAGSVTTF
jgi:hypothetical protein